MADVTLDRVAEVSRMTAALLRELVPLLDEAGLPGWAAKVNDLEAMHAALAADYGEDTAVVLVQFPPTSEGEEHIIDEIMAAIQSPDRA